MPLQRFKPVSGRCKLCRGEIEVAVAAGAPEPNECPKCGQTIAPCPSLNAPPAKILRQPSASEAKAAGFHVLKRIGNGEYEKQ